MSEHINYLYPRLFIVFIALLSSCKSGPFTVFKPASPHEIYERKLLSSGLDQTAMGKSWIELSDSIIQNPLRVDVPYRETGYFPPERVNAAAFSFNLIKGQKLKVILRQRPADGFMIYSDVWERETDGELKLIGSADTVNNEFESDIDQTGIYVLRIQPELLSGGEYTLEVSSGPSLEYPLKSYKNNQIRSFFGDGRDAGARKHEGVDIFSSFRTPVIAIAPGITRINENKLGGKVVWLRPEGKDFTLYYAHLDEQLASNGQLVQPGDTLGLMGNTGNARTTPPHLHFGIYTRGGAVDPLPFINPVIKKIPEVQVDLRRLNATMRTSASTSVFSTSRGTDIALKKGTVMRVAAASANRYRIELPDGSSGFVTGRRVTHTATPLSKYQTTSQTPLYDRPDSSAAVKRQLQAGQTLSILGGFGEYQLVADADMVTGWISK